MNYSKIAEATDYLLQRLPSIPKTAVILGSGLGGFADNLNDTVEIMYSDIPNFPIPTIAGHSGKLVFGHTDDGIAVLAMCGRLHFYEGYSMEQVALPTAVFAILGVSTLIVTTSVGAINENYNVGDIVLIKDHIKLCAESPLRGAHDERLGVRFPDLSTCYTPHLRMMTLEIAKKQNLQLHEGVFCFMTGPVYETPAEIRALRVLGGDIVSMSTVPEVTTASALGMDVLGIGCVSNMASGIESAPLTHDEVLANGKRIQKSVVRLLTSIINQI